MSQPPLWTVPLLADNVDEQGSTIALIADDATRASIARATGLARLPRLEARFHVRRHGKGGLHVTGAVAATVEQTCVVTLEPLSNAVSETVDVIFVPEAAIPVEAPETPEDEDPPEVLKDGAIDLGQLAVEFLMLGVDPYPRKPDAVFAAPGETDDSGSNPFAALAALKKRGEGQG